MEKKQLIKVKAGYFQLLELYVITATENKITQLISFVFDTFIQLLVK